MKKFTLLELMVVVAIIGILLTILMPALSNAREKARRAVCLSNMKQFATAVTSIATQSNGKLPEGTRANSEHNIWLGFYLRDLLYNDYGFTQTNLYCPGMEKVYKSGVTASGIRMGYSYLGQREPLMNKYGYELPLRLYDEPHLPLFTDLNDLSDAGAGWTAVSHLKYGSTEGLRTETAGVTPKSLGSQGGNVLFLDGSARWFSIDSLNLYNSYSPNNKYKSMWAYRD
jgi:prepilin-type N-terminal cleavage/methylation domain-containing protein/prepilin-type processing-associated H-X9-DG protein